MFCGTLCYLSIHYKRNVFLTSHCVECDPPNGCRNDGMFVAGHQPHWQPWIGKLTTCFWLQYSLKCMSSVLYLEVAPSKAHPQQKWEPPCKHAQTCSVTCCCWVFGLCQQKLSQDVGLLFWDPAHSKYSLLCMNHAYSIYITVSFKTLSEKWRQNHVSVVAPTYEFGKQLTEPFLSVLSDICGWQGLEIDDCQSHSPVSSDMPNDCVVYWAILVCSDIHGWQDLKKSFCL